MKMEIDASRLLVHRAAWMGKNGKDFNNAEGSMSKLKAGEVAVWATERAIQILGGNGYSREFPVERMHRDAKIWTIFEGTSEIQRLVISRAISGVHDQVSRAAIDERSPGPRAARRWAPTRRSPSTATRSASRPPATGRCSSCSTGSPRPRRPGAT